MAACSTSYASSSTQMNIIVAAISEREMCPCEASSCDTSTPAPDVFARFSPS